MKSGTEEGVDIEKLFQALTELQRRHAQAEYQLNRLTTELQNRRHEIENTQKKIESNRQHTRELQNEVKILSSQLKEKESEMKLQRATTAHMQLKLATTKDICNKKKDELIEEEHLLKEELHRIENKFSVL